MSAPSHYFESLAGAPVHYDRLTAADYGGAGVPRKFYCDPALQAQLESLFGEIFGRAPSAFGGPKVILSAGTYVNKPGQHGLGKAFDLDGIHWQDRTFIAKRQRRDKALYLAIQALCHKYFGIVLGYNYNRLHKDHLHIDLGRPVKFRETKSTTYFLQEALNTFFDQAVTVDGEFGSATAAAIADARSMIDVGPVSRPDNWTAFLDHVAEEGFGAAGQQATTG